MQIKEDFSPYLEYSTLKKPSGYGHAAKLRNTPRNAGVVRHGQTPDQGPDGTANNYQHRLEWFSKPGGQIPLMFLTPFNGTSIFSLSGSLQKGLILQINTEIMQWRRRTSKPPGRESLQPFAACRFHRRPILDIRLICGPVF
ncbi:hypothetical protein BaRGS_00002361 [Batillaria attramentaria]|uniref:Uncharacterized protein n=1 Tax=Batillaria attramentaria TaxID=370345 RepID=A0ABD0M363_9CAEN